MPQTSGHDDIRIGTLAGFTLGPGYLRAAVQHGFESYELTAWQYLGDLDLDDAAKRSIDALAGRAIISSVGIYGNPLEDAQTERDWETLIRKARLFGCDVVCAFAGALEDRTVDQNIGRFAEVWGRLAKVAADCGVRIAFENCDMGGTWESPRWNIAHSPRAWEMMFDAVPADNLGLEWEPCHQMVSLVDPIAQLRKWVGRIYHLHGKDATVAWDVIREHGTRGGAPYVWHRTPGFGDCNWADIISILRMGGYRGAIDIEGWHDPVYRGDLEMTGQVHGLQYLKRCRGGGFVPNP
ncbi:MAG TPA: sugar phosphate isomerase/epimerase [Chthonomonadales bacterium]|nr:sugar phosphate isomerase/epimerase [Chthonomonadales bacterium]